ncbi:MAG: hypothetical protein ACTHU0_25900 [Kofleriaceae bacterium]
MRERLRSAAQRLVQSPGWQLVIGAAILAIAFPSRMSGSVGLAIVAGALGVGVALAWPQLPPWLRHPPERIVGAIVVAIVVAMGLSTFWDALTVSPDWQMGDWGPQHAVLRGALDAMPGIDTPVWNHAVGTGDAPLELYPKLAYLVSGHAALALGLEDDLPLALMVVAVLVHIAIAATTTLIALRIAPAPAALVVGLATLVDTGAVAHGGTVGLFRWALLHSAMALAFSTVAVLGVLGALARPRPAAAIAIWIGTALACITHPAGLISAFAIALGLAAVALLATDVPPRRALVALGHIALGVALGAAAWMPLAERILAYGQHFPNAIRSPARLLEDLMTWPSPVTAFAILGYAGYFGIVAALWSRRARAVFVAAAALVLLVGLSDVGYLALDLEPGQGVARLGTERLAQLARPFVAAASAYGLAIFFGQVIAGWRAAGRRHKLIAAAVIGVMTGALLRVVPAVWRSVSDRAYTQTQTFAADPSGRDLLTGWAREQVASIGPGAWARALFETDTHEHFHLTAETGLPTFHIGPQPDLLLRERIQDLSPASLRRFDVRWVIAADRSPSLGDPATEVHVGSFRIREVAGWDGQFARIERGTGQVRTTRLDNERVEIEVAASEPVLVALGTGYYPRWRARHESGAVEPVYALPSYPGSTLHVVSAWVAPGRTTFTVDGPLPSDGRGRTWTMLALIACIAGLVVWRVPRWRIRVLRRLARWRARGPRIARLALQIGVPFVLIVLAARGCADGRRPLRAIELGSGVRGTASVEARLAEGPWQTCDYSRVGGVYVCDQLLVAYDASTALLNDAPPSWAFNTSGIFASAHQPGVEMRVRITGRLAGAYWTAVSEGTVALDVSGEEGRVLDRGILRYVDRGERAIELRAEIPVTAWTFTFVREDTLVPPRPYLAGPPPGAPAEVRAIRR